MCYLIGAETWTNGSSGNWWTPATRKNYKTLVRECLSKYFDTLTAGPFTFNGRTKTVRPTYCSSAPLTTSCINDPSLPNYCYVKMIETCFMWSYLYNGDNVIFCWRPLQKLTYLLVNNYGNPNLFYFAQKLDFRFASLGNINFPCVTWLWYMCIDPPPPPQVLPIATQLK